MEPLGTHGYMKCKFNQPVKQDDTVSLSLWGPAPGSSEWLV